MKYVLLSLVVFCALLAMTQTADAQCYHSAYYAPVTTYYAPAAVYYPATYSVGYRQPYWGGYQTYYYAPQDRFLGLVNRRREPACRREIGSS